MMFSNYNTAGECAARREAPFRRLCVRGGPAFFRMDLQVGPCADVMLFKVA